MPLVKCTNCGEEGHVAWHCRKPKRTAQDEPLPRTADPARMGRTDGSVANPPVHRVDATITHELIEAPAFNRAAYQRAYMREYMRKRRARKRGRLPKEDK